MSRNYRIPSKKQRITFYISEEHLKSIDEACKILGTNYSNFVGPLVVERSLEILQKFGGRGKNANEIN